MPSRFVKIQLVLLAVATILVVVFIAFACTSQPKLTGSDPTEMGKGVLSWLRTGDGELNRWIFAPMVLGAGLSVLSGLALLFFDRKAGATYILVGLGLSTATALIISLLQILWLAGVLATVIAAIGLLIAWKGGKLVHRHKNGRVHFGPETEACNNSS